MKLYIDLGNTRLKWLFDDKPMQAIIWRDTQQLNNLLAQWHKQNIQFVYLVSTADEAINTQITNFFNQKNIAINHLTSTQKNLPIKANYKNPSQLGDDRIASLICADALYSKTACVISCGTAITIDFIHNGKHYPGFIMPGQNLMRSALQQETSNVNTQIEAYETPPKTTQQCVQLGIEYAICGAIEKIFAQYQSKFKTPITTVITGGDAKWLNTHLAIPAKIDKTLIIKGLKVAFHQ